VAQWRSVRRLGGQLGVKALKNHHGFHILGLVVGPSIIVLVVIASVVFQNLNTSFCELLCNSRIYVITLFYSGYAYVMYYFIIITYE
jgi:hypothetical protein